jgi:flagellar hook-associated protein 3 FlgL
MKRVSTDMMNNDMQYWLRRTEQSMASMETKMAKQERNENLRDDPLGAARTVRYDSAVTRLQRFEKNAAYGNDETKLSEGYARQTLEVTQRLREIAVQGANGIYTKDDQKYMASEVDELLGELVSLANSKGPDGAYLFSGEKTQTEPFKAVMGASPLAGKEVLTSVQYLGSNGGPQVQVADDSTLPLSVPGNELFWAEKQEAVSDMDARDWRSTADSAISVDGKRIDVKAGDTVYAIAAKINDSGAPVKANIDPRTFSLSLVATLPHQMRLEDIDAQGKAIGATSGGALHELGLLSGSGSAPDNWAPGARVTGGSLFDAAIRLRDSLNRGDIMETGGQSLAGIDAGIDNLNRRITEIGSRSERFDMLQKRFDAVIPDTTTLLAKEKDLDMTQAITDYKMLEYAHKASLGFAGRLFPQTLLDFLR